MHVAYIHQHFTTKTGSSGTRSYELSQRLLQAGHSVTMVCGVSSFSDLATDPGKRVIEQNVDGIRVLAVSEPYSNRMGYARRILAFGRFAREAQRIVSGLKADLVFATSTPLTVGLPGMKAAQKRGVPFVFEVRDLWPELPIAMGVVKNPILRWYLQRMERRIYNAAAWIIALAPGIRDGILRTGYPEDRVSTIPNACDLSLFVPSEEPLVDERFGHSDEFKLVFTGAHGLANGLDAVLDAVAVLKKRQAEGLRFIFIGEGSAKARLMARCRNEGLEAYTTWLPSIPKAELATILPRLDVGLMILKNVPSFYYGTSPNKFFDYIASGLPVLNNYPGWLADMIREHDCGVVIPPDAPDAFADAVLDLLSRRDELSDMGRRGRALAEAQFSRSELGQRFVETLERVHREWHS